MLSSGVDAALRGTQVEQLVLEFQRLTASYTAAELALLTPQDIYECADAEMLQRLKEDRRIERKPAGIHGGELGEYFSMWANTVPDGGLMVLGQEDDGTFSGCLK
jgi:ATP-dependent DNA helicase RecG